MKVLNHPPHSPDLSPRDFIKCFLEISIRLEVLLAAIFISLQHIPKEDYLSAFRDWEKMLQKCVSVKGEYFEGL